MTTTFEAYKTRKISFVELLYTDEWDIKIYTITNKTDFDSLKIMDNIKTAVPNWLRQAEKTTLDIYKKAFLIVHEAREGVWILFNYWTGGEMINTKVFFVGFDDPDRILDSPYAPNSLLCVWELEVFAHERASWIDNVLRNSESPRFDDYLNDVLDNG